ncbi:hypothetical protein [Sphingomonas montana]|uniref:hypothetical protein n=1 Tax=Sphingomonas montana TaxID=1843236 RepID=UPI00101AEBF9|nr:hypothetical protein [Sphingomonas montana]
MATTSLSAAPGTAVRSGRSITGTPAKPCRVDYAYKWLDGMRGDASGMEVNHCDIRVSFRGVELTRKAGPVLGVARDVRIRNSSFALVAPSRIGTIPTGIQCKWGENILVENVTVTGFRTTPDPAGKVYPNGDGLGSEFCVGLTYRGVTSTDNGNGGFDDKARQVLYDHTVSERNDYGYRMWWRGAGNFTGTTMTCIDNRKSCLHLMDGGDRATTIGNAHLTVDTLIVRFTGAVTPILIAEPGTGLRVTRKCIITAVTPPAGPVAFGGTKATRILPASCMDAAGNIVFARRS